jgi:hypothetical protein
MFVAKATFKIFSLFVMLRVDYISDQHINLLRSHAALTLSGSTASAFEQSQLPRLRPAAAFSFRALLAQCVCKRFTAAPHADFIHWLPRLARMDRGAHAMPSFLP